jgi:hypothetical protein
MCDPAISANNVDDGRGTDWFDMTQRGTMLGEHDRDGVSIHPNSAPELMREHRDVPVHITTDSADTPGTSTDTQVVSNLTHAADTVDAIDTPVTSLNNQPVTNVSHTVTAVTMDADNQTVTNLSDKTLTMAQSKLVSKGFNFIPARNKNDLAKLLSDLSEWERR